VQIVYLNRNCRNSEVIIALTFVANTKNVKHLQRVVQCQM